MGYSLKNDNGEECCMDGLVGIDGGGKLVIVSVPGGAAIQQMRELMLALSCVGAFNLDGGASCAMYYDGQYIATPGRQLTTTLQISVNG